MKHQVLGLALAGALAFGAAGESSTPYQELQLQQTPIEAAKATYQAARKYWISKDAGLAAIQLVIVGPGESFDCDYGHRTVHAYGEDATAFYCPNPDAVVTTEKSLNAVEDTFPGQGDDAARFTIYHEFGHGVDWHASGQNASDFMREYESNPVPFELRATRYAGQAAGHTLNTFGQVDIQRYLALDPGQNSWAHGPRPAHYQAFTQGLRE